MPSPSLDKATSINNSSVTDIQHTPDTHSAIISASKPEKHELNNTILKTLAKALKTLVKAFIGLLANICGIINKSASYIYNNFDLILFRMTQISTILSIILSLIMCIHQFKTPGGIPPENFNNMEIPQTFPPGLNLV
ncbi:MAG: hypothetical protein OXD32_06075 [Endozoicomonadaceae bacterium]|nr:hypothetical protein [Endozoicomonadaceae bacterium]